MADCLVFVLLSLVGTSSQLISGLEPTPPSPFSSISEPVLAWNDGALEPQPPSAWLQLRGPIGTVCVTGDDRIGKSTLLSLWTRKLLPGGVVEFPAGHGRDSHTRGMWSAILPKEVAGLGYHLNLCDSQGLKQVAELQQWRLFSANVLVPSVLVYMVINVVQNDQLRDLARMARQFEQLSSSEMGRFQENVSPHLIVLVREESDLFDAEDDDGESGGVSNGGGEGGDGGAEESRRNLGPHLEKVLASPGYEPDKALIRRIFRSREAWGLQELPRSARRALRSQGVGALMTGEDAAGWRLSGEHVLGRVLAALNERTESFPQGGPELVEWYRSVGRTVNSGREGSLGRLVGHSELLATSHSRRRLLQDWGRTVLMGLALFLTFGGVLGRWLDRIAWCSWVLVCVYYVGTSPLITVPLDGLIVARWCDSLAATALHTAAGTALQSVCREMSTYTVAMLCSAAVGVLSYPLARKLLLFSAARVPALPEMARPLAAALILQVVLVCATFWRASLDRDAGAAGAPGLFANIVLLVAMVVATFRLGRTVASNRVGAVETLSGRRLHRYVSERIPAVRELETTAEWKAHYQRNPERDAFWRWRSKPVAGLCALMAQSCGLLGWSWLIMPQCDALLAAGALMNAAHLLWCFASILRWRPSGGDPIESWLSELPDDDVARDEHRSSCKSGPLQFLAETDEERTLRASIEEMRLAPRHRSLCRGPP